MSTWERVSDPAILRKKNPCEVTFIRAIVEDIKEKATSFFFVTPLPLAFCTCIPSLRVSTSQKQVHVTSLADPGRPGPSCPQVFSKSCSFQARVFEQILGSGPPLGSKLCWALPWPQFWISPCTWPALISIVWSQARIQDFGQGGPVEFWRQGVQWAPYLLKIETFPFCLKTAWFWRNLWGKVTPLDPLLDQKRSCELFLHQRSPRGTKNDRVWLG